VYYILSQDFFLGSVRAIRLFWKGGDCSRVCLFSPFSFLFFSFLFFSVFGSWPHPLCRPVLAGWLCVRFTGVHTRGDGCWWCCHLLVGWLDGLLVGWLVGAGGKITGGWRFEHRVPSLYQRQRLGESGAECAALSPSLPLSPSLSLSLSLGLRNRVECVIFVLPAWLLRVERRGHKATWPWRVTVVSGALRSGGRTWFSPARHCSIGGASVQGAASTGALFLLRVCPCV